MPLQSVPAYECRHCKTPLRQSVQRESHGRWSADEGQPFPLGVRWLATEQAYNFALYSLAARSVELLFFQQGRFDEPTFVFRFDPFRNKSGSIWHCRIPAHMTNDAIFYSYRIRGPETETAIGQHAFDGDKLLLDPYVRSVYFSPEFDRSAAARPGSNMGKAPLGLLDECQCAFDWKSDRHVRHEADLVIYEMHVRGFTQHVSSGLAAPQRGTFEGVIAKIPHLMDLGVTAVELMPVFQFDPQEGNYWGYMPLNFFAPHHSYSVSPDQCGQRSEFRRMVQALHAAGIEVFLDVVFNHTSEGNARGPTYSFKAIDNSTYYLASDAPNDPYLNFSGCGNTLRTASPAVRRLIVDSLRYWAHEMHVDGFRFDLASVFTRNADGSVNLVDPPIFAEIAGDPALADVRLIAEPWDAEGTFLLGQRFPGMLWRQWNSHYRDMLQRFVRGDPGLVGDLMTRLYGSSDLFPDDCGRACRPYQSINYITSHDGFTLYDLVSFSRKHNEANGHDNTDGANDFSDNCGVEGDENVSPDTIRLRKQLAKNFCCLLMLSNGTPMFRMGDEFLQTQGGNNNPYNQDNETSWLDWRRIDEHRDVLRFFKEMIAFRKAHPSISRSHFWRDDVQWFGPDGPVDLSGSSQTLAFSLSGRSLNDSDLYVLLNASHAPTMFRLQRGLPGGWRKVIDTAAESPHDISSCAHEEIAISDTVSVSPRAVVVLSQSQPTSVRGHAVGEVRDADV
ncbi:MAG: glycogen-debranching protein [Planctomycetaceae bacterium]